MALVFSGIDIEDEINGDSISTRKPVRVATTTNVILASGFENGDTIDGIVLVTGDRILIKDQTIESTNGIYDVQISGAPIRSEDYDGGLKVSGTMVSCLEGSTNGGSAFICNNTGDSDVIDVNSITFKNFTSGMNGPASSSDTAIAIYDGTTGDVLKNTSVLVDASSNIISTSNITGGVLNGDELNIDNININSNTISSVNSNGDINLIPNGLGEVLLKASPTNSLAAATKQYVDAIASGLSFKIPVVVATASSLPSYTQSGTGIGATLTASVNGSINNVGIDSFTALVLTDRVLVKSEGTTSDSNNGVYTITALGDGSNPWVLTRATDFDQVSEILSGTYVLVLEGTIEINKSFVVSTVPITIDTDAIIFTQFSAIEGETNTASNAGTGGVGLFKQKATYDLQFRNINTGSSKITVTLDGGNDEVDIDLDQTQITGTGVLTAGSINTGFGSINTGNIITTTSTVTGGNLVIDQVAVNDGKITYTGTSGNNQIIVPDALLDALSILSTDSKKYITISTSNEEVVILQNTDITGNLVISGNVDGRNVSVDGGNTDSLLALGLLSLTSAEVTQLQNIDTTLISTSEWGHVGTMDQDVTTNSSVSFNDVSIDDIKVDGSTISSTTTDTSINIIPNGVGEILVKADPVSALGVATKQYVDATAVGLTIKDSVVVSTFTALPSYTQSGAGIGAILTATANGSINNTGIDSVTTLSVTNRVLVKSEGTTSDSHNGIYTITTIGDGSNPWVLTRATDSDTTSEVTTGLYVLVVEGTNLSGSSWVITTTGTITVDTTNIIFSQFGSSGGETNTASNIGAGGLGLFKGKSGTTLQFRNINTGSSKITVTLDGGNDEVDIDLDQTQITGTGVLTAGSINTGFGSINTGNIITTTSTVTGGNLVIDQVAVNDGKITYTGTSGNNQIVVPNNLTNGLVITDGVDNFIQIDSSSGFEEIKILQDMSVSGILTLTNSLSTGSGGTGLISYTTGDLIYSSATNVLGQLGIGSDTNVLTIAGGLPTWDAPVVNTLAQTLVSGNTSGGTDITVSSGDNIKFLRTNNLIVEASTIATVDRTVTFPDPGGDDDIAYLNSTQSFTNKTLIDNTNTIIARELWNGSGTGHVSTYASDPPVTGQVLAAAGTTTATWQSLSGLYDIKVLSISTYTLLSTDDIINVEYTTTGPVAITIPITSIKKKYTITDTGGNSCDNPILVTLSGSDTISGEDSILLDINYISITIMYDTVSKWILI